MRGRQNRLHRRGSAMPLIIIVSVVITGMVMTLAWAAGIQAQMTGDFIKLDQAFYTAEAGAQKVAWYCKNGKMGTITSPVTGTLGGYAYSASWATVSGTTIRITSTGSLGNVSYTVYQTVSPPVVSPPVFASSGDFDIKNVHVVGDIQTGGNFSSGGNGSVTGNLVYSGTASNTNVVTGTVTQSTFTAINMPAMEATLVTAAGLTYNGNQSNKTFDFTAIAGTNKVIYVNGNVTNPIFIGSGTLYVNGTISVGAFGTAINPVDLVASGAITTGNNITIYGDIYSGSDWNRGKVDLTGLAYVNGISASNNGTSTFTMTSAPWFDPRASQATQFTSFAGPMP